MIKIFLIAAIIFLTSCNEILDINISSSAEPVVFGVLDPADSIHYVRLSQTFTHPEIGDVNSDEFLDFQNTQIRLERYWDNRFIQFSDLEKTPEKLFIPDTKAIFPYQLFQLTNKSENEVFFQHFPYDQLRLIIDIPQKPIVYCEFTLVKELECIIPKSDGRSFNMFNFNVIFYTYAYYTEFYLRLKFINRYADSVVNQQITWREFHQITGSNLSADGILINQAVEGHAFFQRIGKLISTNENVKNRKFQSMEILFNCLNEDMYLYNLSSEVIPADQFGNHYSNIVNGQGVIGSRSRKEVSFLMDYRSLDELCNGEYTRHLDFVKW